MPAYRLAEFARVCLHPLFGFEVITCLQVEEEENFIMRIEELISMAKEYFVLGIIGAVALTVVLAGGYLVYKKCFHGEKRIEKRKLVGYAISFCYLVVVVGATLLRGNYYKYSFCPYLFQSYRSAWNTASEVEWRNIILNILMFVPIGFLVPVVFPKMQSFWKVSLTGLGMTILIEGIQLIAKRGIFEADDLLDNTLGAMIGYGMYVLLRYLAECIAKRERTSLHKVLVSQIPTILVVSAFCIMFVRYDRQEFGNLADYTYRTDLSNVSVEQKTQFREEANSAWVYRSAMGTKEETRAIVESYFSPFGAEIDEERTIYDSETAVYYSKDNKYSVWVDYGSLNTSFSNFELFELEGAVGLTREEVEDALDSFSIPYLELAEFCEQENGNYRFETTLAKTENAFVDGWLTCSIAENGQVMNLNNQFVVYEPLRQVELISEQDAYERILDGKFMYYYMLDPIESLVIEKVSLTYSRDTKGYFQPVYYFDAKLNGEEWGIMIPARK